ncbi:MAG: hypothetical protein EA345_14120 [Halomonas sp.]|nr:MAG: hypothetical protein EA345_14120 [Halomonas sp.]
MKRRLQKRLGVSGSSGSDKRPPADFRGLLNDPVAALARANGSPVIIDVPLSRCRTFQELGFLATPDSANPFVMTVQWAQKTGDNSYAGSPLEKYYATVQPTTGADKLGIDNASLRTYPPLHVDAPWRNPPGEAVYQRRARTVRREAQVYGKSLALSDGWRTYGPMTDSMGQLEFQRLMSVTRSIIEVGYDTLDPFNHINAWLLVADDGNWSVWIMDGLHRTCVLGALNFLEIPILIQGVNIINRADADDWPAVQQGALTAEEARQVFDRIFAGQQPDGIAAVWPPAQARS